MNELKKALSIPGLIMIKKKLFHNQTSTMLIHGFLNLIKK